MKPFVIVELDRPRKMRYGMNALIEIEETLGKKISEIFPQDNTQLVGFKELSIVIYAGLKADDKELTLERVGDLIDEYSDIETVSIKMSEAFEASFGKK